MTRRIVVDTDTGIDDAHTLLYLAGRPDAEIVAITSVYGNCVEDDSARNIAYVNCPVGLDVPIARGASAPLTGDARIAGAVHGKDGLGDVGYDRPLPETTEESAAELLVRLGREQPGELDLLALGPLTNLGLALRLDPDLFTPLPLGRLMGGSGPYAPPGSLLMVDANINNDPVAASRGLLGPEERTGHGRRERHPDHDPGRGRHRRPASREHAGRAVRDRDPRLVHGLLPE